MTATKCIGHAIISGESVMLYVATTDGTAAEFTYRDLSGNLKNLKDQYRGKVLQYLEGSVGTPSDLDLIQAKDKNGGVLGEWVGCITVALGHVPQIEIKNIAIPITDGFALEITTTD
jgi:hypothetical protein